ncbi:MAG: NIPSNAP family protein [Alphaproteobacteria bacterium]|nr:NIPSNAP family protein [Alphaproteobacteria bacterium]MDE2112054.1 NIPSNAP family protein [Alphaproteobacteria bacterium]MDE2492438.1 NIPSNAP family protein [Alphaproteobacteria bacterium]
MSEPCCSVVELRQYTVHPGTRDTLIELFDREFVESQEAVGCQVIGQFRDLDDPDRFVWLRGFADMAARRQALGAFYGGPVWKAHRETANATMIDSDNVLLLRPARITSGFNLTGVARPPLGATTIPEGILEATICSLADPADESFAAVFERDVVPALQAVGAPVLAYFVTEAAVNDFPALPVREGENVFVWVSTAAARTRPLPAAMTSRFSTPPQTLRLSSTARSRLRP